MNHFWDGFEKQASMVGQAKNQLIGLRTRLQGGVIKSPTPIKPGQMVVPRSVAPPLPTPVPKPMSTGAKPLAHAQVPGVPKPPMQKSRGVPGVNL